MKQSIEKIPTWAFGYIFNGDMTGLTDEEVRMIDETMKKRNLISHVTLFSVFPPKSRIVW